MTNFHLQPDQEFEPQLPAAQPGRRQLLKALAATGGAITLAGLPGRWAKPVVEAGTLPAHAQVSVFTIYNLRRELVLAAPGGGPATCANNGDTGNLYQIAFDYLNPFGGLQAGATVSHGYAFASGTAGSFELVAGAANISGDGFNGSVTYTVCSAFGPPANDRVTITVFCVDADGRRSNTLSLDFTRPPGALDSRPGGAPFERSS